MQRALHLLADVERRFRGPKTARVDLKGRTLFLDLDIVIVDNGRPAGPASLKVGLVTDLGKVNDGYLPHPSRGPPGPLSHLP